MALAVLPRLMIVDTDGVPRVAASLYFYLPTMTTPITVYTTGAYSVSQANPVVSVSDGFFPAVYINPAVNPTYKLVIKDSLGVTIWTEDNIPALGFGVSDIGTILFPRTATEIAASVTPSSYAYADANWVTAKRYGVVADGTTDDTAALTAAITALGGRGVVSLPKGSIKVTSQILLPAGVKLIGKGNTSDNTIPGATRILRAFTGSSATIVLGDDCALELIDVDNNSQGTGECVQIKGTRAHLYRVSARKGGGDAFRVGATEGTAATFNANLWRLDHCVALNSVGKGFYLDHQNTASADTTQTCATTNSSTAVTMSGTNASVRRGQFVSGTGITTGTRVSSVSGTALVLDTAATATNGAVSLSFYSYPVGIPDVNAGHLTSFDVRSCGDGVVIENAIDCVFSNIVAQLNTGKGFWLKRYARGHKCFGVYTEGNGTEGQIDPGAHKNYIRGNRFVLTSSGWTVSDTDNDFEEFNNGLEGGSPSYHLNRFTVWNQAAGGEALYDMLAESGAALYAQLAGKKDSGAGGKAILRTRSTAGVSTDRISIDQSGDVRFTGQTSGTLFGGKSSFDTTTTGTTIEHGAGRLDIVNSGAGTKTVAAFYDASGAAGSITTNGSGATAYNLSSDERLKERIGPVDSSPIDQITVHHYRRKFDGSEEDGVFAQELHKVYPRAVTYIPAYTSVSYEQREKVVKDEDGKPVLDDEGNPLMEDDGENVHILERDEFWGVDYSKLVPLLLAKVQELSKRVTELEAV
jgi:hypothetical protein